eukprot:CAMPEP_0184405978 /NCGR_PEP_ID=MMETSP0738-20130409/1199_1 /TAXON_ID=385413 /ORGANISM="Thalassiosira miniscula, Strain CCMP1093" /LENGTH=131 /DNA_ID=CAMNT_0026762699 /DNA_START=89 /DNA_END=484 /DNA_ORIENTATION=-
MRELGDQTGLTHTPCWRRLNRLKETGVIEAKRYVLNPSLAGFPIVVFCFVRMKEHRRELLNEFEDAVAKIPEVLQCYSATGTHDYILRVLARSLADYEQTIKHYLVELPYVSLISTSVTLKEVKNTNDIPV